MLPTYLYDLINDCKKGEGVAPEGGLLPETSAVKGRARRTLVAEDAFILCKQINNEPDVSEFLDFTRTMVSRFCNIRRSMSYRNPNYALDHRDALYASGWAGVALIPMALALFALKRSGVDGHMLECGVFKGGTTACMSHACSYLGVQLYAADSFEGLPHGSPDGYYTKGQFLGRLDEVVNNVTMLGDISVVQFISGWFRDSLRAFRQKLALVFLDTDLYESSVDALDCVFQNIQADGVIFSDGLGSARDFRRGHLVPGSDEARAICDALAERGVSHKAVTTGQDFLGLVVPNCATDETLTYSPSFIKALVSMLANESVTSIYCSPLTDRAERTSEVLADQAVQAIDLRSSLLDCREALVATERLVAERDVVIKSTETLVKELQNALSATEKLLLEREEALRRANKAGCSAESVGKSEL
jgi:hypothetical protein